MKKIELGQTIGIIANLGVIAGIVFLAVELRQNNDLLAAQSRAERLTVRTDWINALYRDDQLADLIVRAQRNEELTEAEEFRIENLGERLFTAFEYVYGEVQRGMIDENAALAESWRRELQDLPRTLETWEQAKSALNSDFVQWMEENVVNER